MITLDSFTAIPGPIANFDSGWLVVTDTALVIFDLTTWGSMWLIMGVSVVAELREFSPGRRRLASSASCWRA